MCVDQLDIVQGEGFIEFFQLLKVLNLRVGVAHKQQKDCKTTKMLLCSL